MQGNFGEMGHSWKSLGHWIHLLEVDHRKLASSFPFFRSLTHDISGFSLTHTIAVKYYAIQTPNNKFS